MAKELQGEIVKCIEDQNGNHVIQKCIECCEPKSIDFIVKDVYKQVRFLVRLICLFYLILLLFVDVAFIHTPIWMSCYSTHTRAL